MAGGDRNRHHGEGEFEVINSEMTAERALWLIEWAKRWAMGLEVEE